MRPPNTSLSGCSRYSNQVATPKLPPPPRSAQNRSGSFSSVTVSTSPAAVTNSTESKLSTANRNLQAGFARERNRFDDVRRAVATRDQRGPLVDQAVVDLARLFVALVIRVYQ